VQSSSGLVISRNAADGGEVTFFQITHVTGGELFYNDGKAQINDGDFVAYADAHLGLKFTPDANLNGTTGFGFDVQASLSASVAGLGGDVVTAQITVNPVNDAPVADDASLTTDEDTANGGTATATDVDGDGLTFSLGTQAAHGVATVNADGSF